MSFQSDLKDIAVKMRSLSLEAGKYANLNGIPSLVQQVKLSDPLAYEEDGQFISGYWRFEMVDTGEWQLTCDPFRDADKRVLFPSSPLSVLEDTMEAARTGGLNLHPEEVSASAWVS